MLLDFTFANYRSVKEKVTLSMERIKKLKEDDIDGHNVIPDKDGQVLKSAVIFGANASGKSNVVHAIRVMRDFVIHSAREGQVGDAIPVDAFAFSGDTTGPTMFEIRFLVANDEFRYGFEATGENVTAEWLYVNEEEMFVREADRFDLSENFGEGKDLAGRTRSNASFVSVCASFNGEYSKRIVTFFGGIEILSGLDFDIAFRTTLRLLRHEKFKRRIVDLLKFADTGISDVIQQQLTDESSEQKKRFRRANADNYRNTFFTVHSVHDNDYLLPLKEESAGTRRFFDFIGPILDAVDNDKTLIIDEFDARLHPLLSRELIRYFHKESKQAQLIITTHDSTLIKAPPQRLLGQRLFRRDQIWFTEKGHDQRTKLYSLSEFKRENGQGIRQDESYEKNYLDGRYGAVPILNEFRDLPNGSQEEKKRKHEFLPQTPKIKAKS